MQARVSFMDRSLIGDVRLPTDKSISHRAVIFAAMAEGESQLVGVLDSADVRSTIDAVRALGAHVEVQVSDERGLRLKVTGWGADGPSRPGAPIDCGNSGTTARLIMGVVAGWPISVTLVGDASLSRRPMRRVADPLIAMGAHVELSFEGTMPAEIAGRALRAVEYHSPVASAQVKSAVLLAGLRADGVTTVVEPASSRDHTERMLPGFGVEVTVDEAGRSASVTGLAVLRACDVIVPADPSSAAFLVAGAVLVPGSHVRLPNVAVNPTRLAFARVLQRMGASIELRELPAMGGEPVATIVARHSVALGGVTVSAGEVPSLIDEVPVLAVVATQAAGTTRFEGVGELRVKESDRLQATHDALAALGADVRAGDDWLEVTGPTPLAGCTVASLGDHRLAMAWTIAGLVASGTTSIEGFEAVEVSYPAFAKDLAELGASVEVV